MKISLSGNPYDTTLTAGWLSPDSGSHGHRIQSGSLLARLNQAAGEMMAD